MADRITELSQRYSLEVDPYAIIEDLPVGVRQRVEIIKALYRNADILILDEPTAVLTPQEIEGLFAVMELLRSQGKSIIFITHKLKEVLRIADRIVVLRGGKVVGEADPKTATQNSLAAMMVGREVILTVEKEPAQPKEVVLALDAASRPKMTWATRRCAASRWRCTPARSWAWPASRATARPSW